METGIKGKVAIVTGATRGIGAAMVKVLLEEGASVYGTGRTEESAGRAQSELLASGDRVHFGAADLGDTDSPGRIVAAAYERFGRIDLVLNNAAAFEYRTMDDLEPGDWTGLSQLKLVAYARMIDAAREQLIANRGRVVNVAGIAGCVPTGETPHVGAVNAGILAMTRFYAAQLAKHGVRVNAVSPGDTDTDRRTERLARLIRTGLTDEEAQLRLAATIPMGKPVQPSEVAGVAVALCSDQFDSVTGINILVDGGRHVHYSAMQ